MSWYTPFASARSHSSKSGLQREKGVTKGLTFCSCYGSICCSFVGSWQQRLPFPLCSFFSTCRAPARLVPFAHPQITGTTPLCGLTMLPKTSCDVRGVETARLLRLTTSTVDPISFVLPRSDALKAYFQVRLAALPKSCRGYALLWLCIGCGFRCCGGGGGGSCGVVIVGRCCYRCCLLACLLACLLLLTFNVLCMAPRVLLKTEQDDVFRPARAPAYALGAVDGWLGGANADPLRVSLAPAGMPLLSEKPPEVYRRDTLFSFEHNKSLTWASG